MKVPHLSVFRATDDLLSRTTKRFAQRPAVKTHGRGQNTKRIEYQSMLAIPFRELQRRRMLKTPTLSILLGSSEPILAARPSTASTEHKSLCFISLGLYDVSLVVDTCEALFEDFVDSFKP